MIYKIADDVERLAEKAVSNLEAKYDITFTVSKAIKKEIEEAMSKLLYEVEKYYELKK